ncbi:hypothetical protein CPLU01_13357 [Colletotrichum plurivorum]|uniref:Uncharacterized protein n=1 Tax=Colletotrichum plurivorum TaxID=2175906 RepID=A0A8H6JS47_9PEZI|nr:hypothetical protein CPLU01_13357 [Colletotrichum plurivorum]
MATRHHQWMLTRAELHSRWSCLGLYRNKLWGNGHFNELYVRDMRHTVSDIGSGGGGLARGAELVTDSVAMSYLSTVKCTSKAPSSNTDTGAGRYEPFLRWSRAGPRLSTLIRQHALACRTPDMAPVSRVAMV